jgi:hypothetical protein
MVGSGVGVTGAVGSGVAATGIVGSAAWEMISEQPVSRRDMRTKINLAFIFDPFDIYHGDIEVPQLFQKATQGGLVSEGADEEGLAVLK